MLSVESGVSANSNYYIHTASTQAKKAFFYPVCVGFFQYDETYHLSRDSYDSFLLMYIKKGNCLIKFGSDTYIAKENQIVLIDCYKPHAYYTKNGWEALWLHFDGIAAREYFNLITDASGYVLTLKDPYIFKKSLQRIYDVFHSNIFVKEALVSQYITNALTELVLSRNEDATSNNQVTFVEETILYMKEHLCENITLNDLAASVSLSPFYFTRLFKKETGFTPHEYLIATRINVAKFLLKNTSSSVKEICYNTGFSSESCFCSTFKKWEKVTPSVYRSSKN